jgi:hypothetical protein
MKIYIHVQSHLQNDCSLDVQVDNSSRVVNALVTILHRCRKVLQAVIVLGERELDDEKGRGILELRLAYAVRMTREETQATQKENQNQRSCMRFQCPK